LRGREGGREEGYARGSVVHVEKVRGVAQGEGI